MVLRSKANVLFDFLLIGFEFRGVDEGKQRKAEAVAKAFYGDDAGITAFPVNNILYR